MEDKIKEEFSDEDGNKRSLYWMVRNKPEWTQSRMNFYINHFKSRDKEIKKLRDALTSIERCSTNNRIKTIAQEVLKDYE